MDCNLKQLINFLDPKLSPKVTCDTPVTDYYGAENLISNISSVKSRGFLAYQSVKPPVELELEFICNISIHCVKLNTTVGTQKCSGIEIFSKPNKTAPYVSIGRIIYNKAGVIFCNGRIIKPGHPLVQQENDKEICYLKSNTHRSFLDCAFLKVLIFRTVKSVPCMGSIEVWGVPARSCSSITVQTIHKITQNIDKRDSLLSSTEQVVPGSSNQVGSSQEVFEIPEDFKDDLTFEIMTIPMTLPSGKTVDQSTLDKHIENEKSFGRKPCDPFTGKKFTENCKPVLNAALKSRIDLFMMQNSHRTETYKMARIVGRSLVYDVQDLETHENRSDKRRLPISLDSTDNEEVSAVKNMSQKISCFSCDTSENLYVIASCNHIYCRTCILESCKKLECFVCKAKFKRDSVVKQNV